jgi:anti-sigma B factor antagonist
MRSSIRNHFAISRAGAAVDCGNEAGGAAKRPVGTRVIAEGRPRADARPLAGLSVQRRGDAVAVSLRGELDLLSASSLQACLSGIRYRGRERLVVDLTGLAFIDCACLRVLAACREGIQARGHGFALAGPQGAVLRILSVTGLLSRFEVYDSVEGAVTGSDAQRTATFLATPSGSSERSVPVTPGDGSRAISGGSRSQGTAAATDNGSRRGGGAVPAPGWLS